MAKTAIHLEVEVAEVLHQMASARGRSEEELLAELIRREAAAAPRPTRPRPKGIAMFDSGRSDVSERAKELVRRAIREGRWP